MEDPEPPSVQPKKKLLFKRTIQRKPTEQPKDDDDGLSLFSRSNEFFPTVIQDREREAAEKAEKERNEKLERERRAKEQERLRNQRLSQRHKVEEEEADDETPSAKKRRLRTSLSDHDHDDGHNYDDDIFTTNPHKPRKSSAATPLRSPSLKRDRDSSSIARTPRSTRSSRVMRSGRNPSSSAAAITLDSSDDDVKPHLKKNNSFSPLGHKKSPAKRQDSLEQSDLELDPGVSSNGGGGGEEGDAAFNCYIQGALERAEKRKQARLAREASSSIGAGGGGGSQNSHNTSGISGSMPRAGEKSATPAAVAPEESAVQILISSALEGIHPIVFKRRLHQPLAVVHSTWVEQQVVKGAPVPRAVLQDMFFTWRGDKVYQTTTLETLGIRPVGGSGGDSHGGAAVSLYPTPRYGEPDPPEGYYGRDKVHFEAWTQSLYEEYLRRRERERRRARGELVSDDEDDEDGDGGAEDGEAGVVAGADGKQRHRTASKEPQEKLVKIILKARGMDPEHVKARPSTAIATLALVFKRLKKLAPEANVELHWDGEVLDPSSTVEDAEIEDLDSIEVHIK
ncbi:hypothetical protein SLS62_004778 [Diatrype stigma]|uniref:Ubiquitin-like domain-containing protein n=1 Tax=Diatrype stigma TaxID=117547 RepID=A0AAN9YT29_9PEZI